MSEITLNLAVITMVGKLKEVWELIIMSNTARLQGYNNIDEIVTYVDEYKLSNDWIKEMFNSLNDDNQCSGYTAIEIIGESGENEKLESDKLLNGESILILLNYFRMIGVEVLSILAVNFILDSYISILKVSDGLFKIKSSQSLPDFEKNSRTFSKLVNYKVITKEESLRTLVEKVFNKFDSYTLIFTLNSNDGNIIYIFCNSSATCLVTGNTVVNNQVIDLKDRDKSDSDFSNILFKEIDKLRKYMILGRSSLAVV